MSQPGPPVTPQPALRTVRLVVGAMGVALLVIALAWAFVVPFAAPPLVAVVAVLLAAALAAALLSRQGRRVEPLPAGMPADRARDRATAVFQSSLMLRAAFAEIPAFVAIALSVALRPGSWWTLALGVAVGLVLLGLFVWPRPEGIDRLASALEAQGTPSSLRETFGVPARGPYDAPPSG
ncbi:hypothetical protein [Lapillicoccus jejuensis]|uniref:Uncharacterized protein n=1 Tax=Lapillicoccus jejuensis TaxID=402171 RepID=A0A542DVJ4_9MICO|nr:hypothetical protein [Lapillicoccus jejuensis]TQJ07098.1 hypothetical protein FB458_0145 [Lapillicoccus jejuensis]